MRRQRCQGLTMVELVLALAGTAVIGLAVVTMAAAVAYGTQSDKDMRSIVVKHKMIDARLSAMIRESRMVLAAGEDYIVLWRHDVNESDSPDLSEICRIELTDAGNLVAYHAPHDLSPAQDTAFSLSSDFNAHTNNLKGNTNFPAHVWGVGISDFAVAVNHHDVREANLVSYRFTVHASDLQDTAINAAHLRNRLSAGTN